MIAPLGLGTSPRLPFVEREMTKVRRWWASWGGDVGLAFILVVLPFLFFWRFVTPNLADRMTFARGDFLGQYYPLRLFVAQQLGLGHVPLWDPYIYAGQPALADIQSGTFYPPNLLAALLLGGAHFTVLALELQVILHFSLAGCFTFLFVRHLTGSRFAAVVSALTYTYGGYMTSFPVRQLTMLGVGVWLPLLLLFLDMGIQRVTAPADRTQARQVGSWLVPVIFAGVVFGVSLLGGHPQTSLYVAYACIAYVVYRLWPFRTEGGVYQKLAYWARSGSPFVLVPIIGVGLAAVQLLPTLEFIGLSTRSELNYAAVSWGLPIHELVSLLYPGYQGNSPQYLGILPMILAGAGLFLGWRWKDRALWAGMAIVSLLLSLGGNTFLYSFFYVLIPGFGSVRDQERVVFLFAFSLAVLAGYGAEVVASRAESGWQQGVSLLRQGVARFAVAFLLLTTLFLYGWTRGQAAGGGDIFVGTLRHHVFTLLLVGGAILWLASWPTTSAGRLLWKAGAIGLIGLNLFTMTWEFHIHRLPEGGYFPENSTVTFLRDAVKSQFEPFRISSAGLLPGGSSAGAVYGFRDITGNSPLHLAAFEDFGLRMGEWRKWQLLNVRYVLDKRAIDSAGLRRVHEEGEVKTYEVTDPFPQAWIVHDARIAGNDDELFALLNADGFDLRRAAVLSQSPGLELQPSQGSSAQTVESGPGRFVIQANLTTPGLLVLSEVYYPGWQATVDGQPVPLLRADDILRGVPLPAGSHRVEIRYAPASVRWGAVISGVTLFACVVVLAVGVWVHSRPGSS